MQANEIETDWDDIKRIKEAQPWFAPAANFYISTDLIWLKMLSFSQVLPYSNIKLVILRHSNEYYFGLLFSLEQCTLIFFQCGNIVTKE